MKNRKLTHSEQAILSVLMDWYSKWQGSISRYSAYTRSNLSEADFIRSLSILVRDGFVVEHPLTRLALANNGLVYSQQ